MVLVHSDEHGIRKLYAEVIHKFRPKTKLVVTIDNPEEAEDLPEYVTPVLAPLEVALQDGPDMVFIHDVNRSSRLFHRQLRKGSFLYHSTPVTMQHETEVFKDVFPMLDSWNEAVVDKGTYLDDIEAYSQVYQDLQNWKLFYAITLAGFHTDVMSRSRHICAAEPWPVSPMLVMYVGSEKGATHRMAYLASVTPCKVKINSIVSDMSKPKVSLCIPFLQGHKNLVKENYQTCSRLVGMGPSVEDYKKVASHGFSSYENYLTQRSWIAEGIEYLQPFLP